MEYADSTNNATSKLEIDSRAYIFCFIENPDKVATSHTVLFIMTLCIICSFYATQLSLLYQTCNTALQISNQQLVCKILITDVMENWSTHRLNGIKNA